MPLRKYRIQSLVIFGKAMGGPVYVFILPAATPMMLETVIFQVAPDSRAKSTSK